MRHKTRENVGNSLLAIIGTSVMLPSQWAARRQRKVSGEEELAMAVLEDVVDIFRRQASESAIARELKWGESDDTNWPFSFVNLCDALNIDMEAARERLRVLAATDRRNQPGWSKFKSVCLATGLDTPGHTRSGCTQCRTRQGIARRAARARERMVA